MFFRKHTRVQMDSTGKILGGMKCVRCGYDLRGRRLTDRCPECGELVRTTEETNVQANLMRWTNGDYAIAYSAIGGIVLSIILTIFMVLKVFDMSSWRDSSIRFWITGASWGGSVLLSLILMGVNSRRAWPAQELSRILPVIVSLSLIGMLLFGCCGFSIMFH